MRWVSQGLNPSYGLTFFGTVDFTAGTITISGMPPEERTKLQDGKSAQASLTCAPAKQRLF